MGTCDWCSKDIVKPGSGTVISYSGKKWHNFPCYDEKKKAESPPRQKRFDIIEETLKTMKKKTDDKDVMLRLGAFLAHDLRGEFEYRKIEKWPLHLSPQRICNLVYDVYYSKTIPDSALTETFRLMINKDLTPKQAYFLVEGNVKDLNVIVEETISVSKKAVEDYKNGNVRALHSLVGAILKQTKKYKTKEVIEAIEKNLK